MDREYVDEFIIILIDFRKVELLKIILKELDLLLIMGYIYIGCY